MSSSDKPQRYEFHLQALDPSVSADKVRESLAMAVQESTEAMRQEGTEVEAQAEIKGAFAGVGETAVILLVAFLKGAAGTAGAASAKYFFDHYLKPKLQKRNLVVSELQEHESASGRE